MERQTTLIDSWLALYQRKYIILLVVVSTCVFAWSLSVTLSPLYEARTTFYAPANASPTTFVGATFADQLAQNPLMPLPEEKAAAASLGILRSRSMMDALHEAFPQRRLDQLRKNVDVTVGSEFLIEVYVRDADPKVAAAIANRLPQLYERFHREILSERIRRIVATLSDQHRDLSQRLADQTLELRGVQERTGVLSPDLSAERTAGLVGDLRAQLETTDSRLAAVRQSLETLQSELQKERALYREGELVLTSPRLDQLQARLIDLNAKQATIRQDPFNPNLPTRQAETEAQLKETALEVEKEIRHLMRSRSKPAGSIHEKLRQDLVDRSVELSSLQASRIAQASSLARREKDLGTLPATTRRIEDLKSSIASLRVLHENVGSHLMEARLQAGNLPPSIVIVEPATEPDRPVFPLPLLNTIVAGLVGLVVGCYYVLLLNYLSRLRRHRLEREMDSSPLEEVSLTSVEALLKEWRGFLPGAANETGRTERHRINGQFWEISERRTPGGQIVSRRRRLTQDGSDPIVLEPPTEGSEVAQEEAYVVYDPDGRILEVSQNYAALYPDLADFIKPGASLQDVLRAAAKRSGIVETQGRAEEWVRQKAHWRLHPESND